jgi:hypothetical protein
MTLRAPKPNSLRRSRLRSRQPPLEENRAKVCAWSAGGVFVRPINAAVFEPRFCTRSHITYSGPLSEQGAWLMASAHRGSGSVVDGRSEGFAANAAAMRALVE